MIARLLRRFADYLDPHPLPPLAIQTEGAFQELRDALGRYRPGDPVVVLDSIEAPVDCPACHYRGGEPEGHAEWCDYHPVRMAESARPAAAACEGFRVRRDQTHERCARCGWPEQAHLGAFQPHFPKEEMDRLVEVRPLLGWTPGPGSDNLSLGVGEGLSIGVGVGESDEEPDEPTEPGLPRRVLIQPICHECGSQRVILAHVYFGGGEPPAVAVLCDACHLAAVPRDGGVSSGDVLRRLRSTRSGDWRYRVR